MARQRVKKERLIDSKVDGKNGKNTGHHKKPPTKEKKKKSNLGNICINIAIVLCIVSSGWFCYAIYMRSLLANRIITPHPSLRILNSNSTSPALSPAKYWGSYRPQVYFGMKTRSQKSIVTGLMWLQQFKAEVNLRHTCEQGDRLPSYGWLMHDGINFGVQEIKDNDFILTTEFVKRVGGQHGGDWTWRITAKPQSSAPENPVISLLFYVASDGQGILQPHVEEKSKLMAVSGSSEELGKFKITFLAPTALKSRNYKYASYNYLQAHCPSLEMMTDIVKNSLNGRFVYNTASAPRRYYIGVDSYRPPPKQGGDSTQDNFLVHQVTVQVPFEVEVLLESESFTDRSDHLSGEVFASELERWKQAFDEKFNAIFKLPDKGFPPQQIKFAKAVFSNTIGGMGYFYGQSYVQSIYNEYPLPYLEGPLYTAVPSRSFFPRGFLWDEGFHQLLISKWNPSISKEVIGHWLDMMNVEGWIPREQILDNEARSKVPSEFIVQRNENANPPTLFLTLQKLIEDLNGSLTEEDKSYLKRLFPRLKTWYDWYNSTQVGSLPSTYRWRGRDTDTNLFLNPKTLTSGLDDYPRASHPSEDERHVDLRCWMTLASKIMTDIAKILGVAHQDYQDMYEKLSDNSLLQELHWSEDLKAFSDYGNHTQSIILEREKIYVPPGQPRQHVQPARLIRSVRKQPKLQYVNAFGYVSLFPFLLQILQPDSPKLQHILKDIRDDEKLWTPYGLRSLSKSSPLYLKRNTEYDPPYWRGPIWINMNYLVVKALHYYSTQSGPYQEMAAKLYQELRTNLISNMYKQFVQTGYLWEQYNDSTGRGQGSHPFTGWSSLIVLIMAEQY
ncbi:mannosyl-oligosaccharide glucosidase [Carcharodon carcharias]|uniref:mannosyl-oligosaccharide glucosidase n=1 Tax=Carcharodon carcharias TaxID=13397 RepID=UPI001B7E685A|nr:mannosyl-oligosaccharide glucosidase [Carcharodon carcharias]